MPALTAFVLAGALAPLAARAGIAWGLVDRPGGSLKIHRRPISVLGGVVVVAAVVGALAVDGAGLAHAVVAALVFALGLGLIDDVRSLSPRTQLAAQTAIGAVLAGGVTLEPLGLLGRPAVARWRSSS
jgi:UDP-N-acetylmuramyl pentapeptide phosphotransferase/UDP-N-acetylglucosamine-1-phosphate transferase